MSLVRLFSLVDNALVISKNITFAENFAKYQQTL
jgi:hypothetical protein